MRFIERLRQEKEARDARAHEALERECLAQERRKKADVQHRQREEEEKKRHEERHLKAGQFQEESGIFPLAKEMERLLEGEPGWEGYSDYQLRDRDSVAFPIRWGWHSNHSREWNDTHYAYPQKVSGSGKYFVIETCPDGTMVFHAGWFGSSSISLGKWRNNKGVLEVALDRAYTDPRSHSWRASPSEGSGGMQEGRGPCLPGHVLISAATGLLPIKNLKVGDFIWTTDKFGRKTKTRIIKKCRSTVPKNHKITYLILKDGREIFVSAYHPTIDGKPVISLKKGQPFDGSLVSSITIVPYKDKYTYDILPEGDTGSYWANNILLGSTLFDKFEPSELVILPRPQGLNYEKIHPWGGYRFTPQYLLCPMGLLI